MKRAKTVFLGDSAILQSRERGWDCNYQYIHIFSLNFMTGLKGFLKLPNINKTQQEISIKFNIS